jgi:cell wall-associated NlpC family hydrolase
VATFIYSPTITVHVEVTNKQKKQEIIDISQDLIAGKLNLRTNGMHLFQFQLQNAQRKYDSLIRPMDRIVISMSRIGSPLRVFSGYLNNGPIFSVWPRVLNMTASCTLKKLQFWYWDASSVASQNLIMSWQQSQATNSNVTNNGAGTQPNAADGGIRDMVIQLLTEVVGWPQEQIHIGAIPDRWFDFATSVGDEIVKASDESALIGTLGGGAAVGGSSLTSNSSLPAGNYAGVALNATQAANAAIIYNVAATRGLTPHDAALGIGTAMQESSLTNLKGGDKDSVGLFQQRPSQGWGTVAQIEDPQYSAGKFFDALVKVPSYETLPFTAAAQAVQRSGIPGAYAKWENFANAVVAVLVKNGQTQSNASSLTGGAGGAGALASGGATGTNIASVAFNLIKSHPPGYIRYQEGGDSAFNDPDPRVLDCSSFVDWVYYHTVGRPLNPAGGRTTAHTEGPMCVNIDVEDAKNIKGALLFIGPVGSESHVEVSLGNGYTAAAHTSHVPLAQQVDIQQAGGFTHGGLLPGINYSNAATTPAAAHLITTLLHYKTTTSDPNQFGPAATATNPNNQSGSGTTDPFNALVNVYTWGFNPSNDFDVFAGPRAMMNDEPIMPYISNLLGASMRSWCSAPNGDFMAWFPDYFNIWGITAIMNVKAIELMDFTVDWSDQQIVTHQYVVGVPQALFDTSSGSVSPYDPTGGQGQLYWELYTQGVATMDFPQIFRAIFGQDATTEFVQNYLSRFGGRPNMITIPTISQGRPEFFMALYLFMQRWANQFQANVPMTFMPELWPGMILRLSEFNFQAYITEVEHTFQFGPDGGFQTNAQICAPARIDDQTSMFGLLPLGGQVYAKPVNPNKPIAPPTNTTGAPPLPLPSVSTSTTGVGALPLLSGGN